MLFLGLVVLEILGRFFGGLFCFLNFLVYSEFVGFSVKKVNKCVEGFIEKGV